MADDVQTHGYVTDLLNAETIDFIRQRHSRPFFVYLSHKAMHPETKQAADGTLSDPNASNFIPAPRHKKLFEGAKLPRRPNWNVPPLDKPALQQKIAGLAPLGPETGSTDDVDLEPTTDAGLGR